MHSFGLTERWIVLAEFPYRRQPAAARVQRPPVHRELPLEARAWDALHAARPSRRARRRARSPPTPFFGFHHVNALRGRRRGGRRHLRVRGRRGSSRTSTSSGLREGKPIARARAAAISHPPGRRRVEPRARWSPTSSCRGSTTAAATSVPYRYVWGVGTGGHRLAGADRQGRSRVGRDQLSLVRARLLSRRARVRRRARGARARMTASCSRSCSTPSAAARPAGARRPRPERARPRRGAAPHPVRVSRPVQPGVARSDPATKGAFVASPERTHPSGRSGPRA